jgi:hypothetical protein
MTPNERLKLELFAAKYRDAIETDDFETQASLLEFAATLPGSTERVLDIHAELEAEQAAAEAQLIATAVEKNLPGARIMSAQTGPITVGQVATELLRALPVTWTAEQQMLNDRLKTSTEALPDAMGLLDVSAWLAKEFGTVPDGYPKLFRQIAHKLRTRQNSNDVQYQLAARRGVAKPEEPK